MRKIYLLLALALLNTADAEAGRPLRTFMNNAHAIVGHGHQAVSPYYFNISLVGAGVDSSDTTINGVSGAYLDIDDGAGISFKFGQQYNPQFRVEGELVAVSNDYANTAGSVDSSGLYINGYYDFVLPNLPIKPYIGAGVGFAGVEDSDGDWDDYGMSTQLRFGASWQFSPRYKLNVGYRYNQIYGIEFSQGVNNYEFDLETSGIELGFTFDF